MKQIISLSITAPTGGYSLEVKGVYQVDNKLIVITKAIPPDPRFFVTQAFDDVCVNVMVNTDTDHELPVEHYHVGVDYPEYRKLLLSEHKKINVRKMDQLSDELVSLPFVLVNDNEEIISKIEDKSNECDQQINFDDSFKRFLLP